MKRLLILTFLLGAFSFNSCKKKHDEPPMADVANGHVYSVAELKAIATCSGNCNKRFTNDAYLVGVVIADELSGNFYKEIYVRDRYNTGGIHLDMKASHCNFFIGDSVHLNLKGYDVNLNSSTGMLEVDTVDFEKSMVKFASGANPQPIDVGISCNYSNYLCDLVRLSNVKFLASDANLIWADPISQTSLNHYLRDIDSNVLIVRTSNYAKFAQQKTPSGIGSIVGIATAYSGTNQMAIRVPEEANMNGSSFGPAYLSKDFNDNSLTSGGWTQASVIDPSVMWSVSSFSGAVFAKISGFYSSTNHNTENWLISPAIDLSASSNPVLMFKTAAKFAGTVLEVWVSTTYTSGTPSPSNWTQLSGFNLSPNNPGNYAWTSSCTIPLSGYRSATTRIAFRYQSKTTGATTYEVDDIKIREN